MAPVMVLLAFGMAITSLAGPLALGLMEYRTSPTTLNQLLGSDAATLFVIAPLALVTALLARRGHAAAPLLASGIGAFAVYTYAQLVIGQEYLRIAGNVERFFPLLLVVFVLAEAAFVLGWRSTSVLPPVSRRVERAAAYTLLALAVFLVFGQHMMPIVTAWTDPSALTEYASSPTPFWLVKLMDLGIVVPVAVVTGLGLLRGRPWARRAAVIVLTAYSCLAVSVTSMALVMLANSDPDASAPLALGFAGFALLFLGLTVALYRPLFQLSAVEAGTVGSR
ncbi:hypothetical protein [Nocardioides sp.]|uniref:hypothetical protein n=1 Tax=Nocardioides sp. TaxID=35761 RepID=UPI002D80A43F|nr:hypothetical protein [Nocardioides sp.]